jgi:PIN domain nuclease of toxin-antitoxin system
VRILLDTHILLWALADSPRLSARARELLADPDSDCWVSSASVWEIAIKVGLGKQQLEFPLARLEAAIACQAAGGAAPTVASAVWQTRAISARIGDA